MGEYRQTDSAALASSEDKIHGQVAESCGIPSCVWFLYYACGLVLVCFFY